MAEKRYIEREALFKTVEDYASTHPVMNDNELFALFCSIPAADVRPVVTCKRCVYHFDCGYHYCNKWCVNCPDDADFFCSYGEEES